MFTTLTAIVVSLAPPAAELTPKLPLPRATPSVTKFPKVVGWPEGKAPTAPDGFTVTRFASGIATPRWIYVLPNGDVLVAQSTTKPPVDADKKKLEKKKEARQIGTSPDTILLFRDADGDGTPEVVREFATGLNQPFGMALLGEKLYVANTNAVVSFDYQEGQLEVSGEPRHVIDLPAGGYNNHWTRNVIASKDGKKLLVTVGSASNVMEYGSAVELLRACVLEMNPDGTALRVFASGLRNPVGLAYHPESGVLWTAVNERDHLGDELVPDYITSVQDGAFYGWPYSYFGQNVDPRRENERPDLVQKSLSPEVPMGAHTASLGLAFGPESFPEKYRGGAFVGQHGSWNRSAFSGYQVAFVKFEAGKPIAAPEGFLTGFIKDDKEVYGRPVGVAFAKDGAMLVADDAGKAIWRVAPAK